MDGILNIYKEQDFTSFDVIARLRGILHQRKIGHTGTLDPMAEGVLPVCVGNATKLCEMLTDHDKVYETVMLLGVTFDTEDVFGTKLTQSEVLSSDEEVRQAALSFVGGYDQTPPMYSAKKVDGKKLYDLAREGKVVERKSVHVDIYDIEILNIDLPRVTMRVHCGKGTYIRTLISDIGKKLGCGAAMEKLTRVAVADFKIEDALTLSRVEELVREGEIEKYLVSPDAVFSDCDSIVIPERFNKIIDNGNVINEEILKLLTGKSMRDFKACEKFRIYDETGNFRAVYEYSEAKKSLKPYKMFISV